MAVGAGVMVVFGEVVVPGNSVEIFVLGNFQVAVGAVAVGRSVEVAVGNFLVAVGKVVVVLASFMYFCLG